MTINKRGFTLIELMIIVAIIGILAAIAVPKLEELSWRSNNKERAKHGLAPLPKPDILKETEAQVSATPHKIVQVNVDGHIMQVDCSQ